MFICWNALHLAASVLSIPARIFPIFFPMGNMATGFFIVFSLIAGVVGVANSVTGLTNVLQWDAPNLNAAASSSLLTWALTLLAMGLVNTSNPFLFPFHFLFYCFFDF